MQHINIDQEDESVKRFLQSLPKDPEGSIIELGGEALLRVLPPSDLTDNEQQVLIARGREIVRRVRERNANMPAKEVERTVGRAVREVRRSKQQ